MIPKLVFNDNSEINIIDIIEDIQKYEFCLPAEKDSYYDVCRIGGIKYREGDDKEADIIAWQCNMANISNADVKLPTIITIHLDAAGVIRQIELNDFFKGSQGIPCSQKYLNRKLKELFLNSKLSSEEPLLYNQFATCCRHTYELMIASCTFREWCIQNGKRVAFVSEVTAAYQMNEKIIAIDRISLNGKESMGKIEVNNYKGNIHYEQNGAIGGCKNIIIKTYLKKKQHFVCNEDEDVKKINANSKNEFCTKLMKRISKCWLRMGRILDVDSKFYFSQIWPPTFLGIITQMLGLVMFGNSYSYFQHVISGLQTNEGKYLCIGVVEDIQKAIEFFNDIRPEDYFE